MTDHCLEEAAAFPEERRGPPSPSWAVRGGLPLNHTRRVAVAYGDRLLAFARLTTC